MRPDRDRPRIPEPERGRPPAWEPEEWTAEAPATRPASPAPGTQTRPPARRRGLPRPVAEDIGARVDRAVAPRVQRRLAEAAKAVERDHLPDAVRILRPLAKEAPEVSAVRELAGVALYGTGRWAEAAKELEAFRALTGSVEQHPVLADCYRALKRYGAVARLWVELREASPSAQLVTEGRIVAAGALADQGDLRAGIRLLEQGRLRPSRQPDEHHLRLWYALADLYERVGDAPRARELFGRVVAADPGMADAAERLAALS